jgi:hypothetical protein
MANPGYPQQMGQMPPGMGPPMGGPPMGGPPTQMRPVKRGTSKAVPVVVSAGLAVGVFCGLLFGVGTGKKDAVAAPSKATNAKDGPVEDTTHMVQTPTKPITSTAQLNAGSAAATATGSASGSAVAAAGSAAGSAALAPKLTKLTIKVKPDAAASVAKVQIDGKDITGSEVDLPADKKSVKIAVTAAGFHSFEPKSYDVSGDDMTIEIELTKRSGGGASPGFGGTDTHKPTVPTHPPGGDKTPTPPKKKPGGLIDI